MNQTSHTSPSHRRDLSITRIFEAPIDLVWEVWVDPKLVMRWWGPKSFTAPSARIDFRVGGISLLCMRAPAEFGGQDFYSTWEYKKIIPLERIEYIHNLADQNGEPVDPVKMGLPPDFPKDTRNVVTFKDLGNDQTEMTITEYDLPGPDTTMGKNAEMGLIQSLDKMAKIFAK